MVTRCHSSSFVVTIVVNRCTTRCHSLSLAVLLVVTRCITCLSFHKRSRNDWLFLTFFKCLHNHYTFHYDILTDGIKDIDV